MLLSVSRNFAVVGVGCIGLEHIRNVLLLPDAARIAAMVDTSPEMLRDAERLFPMDHTPVKSYASADHLFHDMQNTAIAIDAIIICTPNFTHIDVISAAIEHTSAHLLIEKPLCTTVEDCLKLQEMQKADPHSASRVVWIGMEYRFMPAIAKLIAEVHSGKVGIPRMLAIREHRFPFLRKVGHWNRFNRYSGGTLVEKCCHFFDLMRLILRQRPVRVIASGGQDVEYKQEAYVEERAGHLNLAQELQQEGGLHANAKTEAPDILDNAYVIVEFDGGARAMLDLCMFAENSLYQVP
jgi:myo-inositol 2-dehydrogenase/D-chiro-inositol 1-dehydrogenase